MRPPDQVFLGLIVCCALGFVAGTRANESMRDPLTLLVFASWLASIGTMLWLIERRRP